MVRILSTGIETVAAAVVLIPVLLVMGKFFFRSGRKTILYIIFSLYLAAVYAVVGLPCVIYARVDFSLNFVPIAGILEDFRNSILNIILFVPLGMLLPVLSGKFRIFRNTVLFGLCMTLLIEILQIFTYRATDINDIIMNVAGTAIGYPIAEFFMRKVPQLAVAEQKGNEVYVVCGIVFAVMFFIQPFLSGVFWNMAL